MAVLRATSFFIGLITGPGIVDVYTVPTGKKAILKYATLQEASGVACTAQLRQGTTAAYYAVNLAAYSGPGSSSLVPLWLVFDAGTKMSVYRSNGGQIAVSLQGSLMTV